LQISILQGASAAVRPGGRLVYSICSTEPEEGEMVVRRFLETNHGFSLVRPCAPAGVEAWLDEAGYLRTFPSSRRWDSFFAALIMRRS
jgi:16S rRNA (cytosine967-C5)-methyltransferase